MANQDDNKFNLDYLKLVMQGVLSLKENTPRYDEAVKTYEALDRVSYVSKRAAFGTALKLATHGDVKLKIEPLKDADTKYTTVFKLGRLDERTADYSAAPTPTPVQQAASQPVVITTPDQTVESTQPETSSTSAPTLVREPSKTLEERWEAWMVKRRNRKSARQQRRAQPGYIYTRDMIACAIIFGAFGAVVAFITLMFRSIMSSDGSYRVEAFEFAATYVVAILIGVLIGLLVGYFVAWLQLRQQKRQANEHHKAENAANATALLQPIPSTSA